jgi:hypothetical protein
MPTIIGRRPINMTYSMTPIDPHDLNGIIF